MQSVLVTGAEGGSCRRTKKTLTNNVHYCPGRLLEVVC